MCFPFNQKINSHFLMGNFWAVCTKVLVHHSEVVRADCQLLMDIQTIIYFQVSATSALM